MPLWDVFREKGLWIGLGAAALTVVLLCALGALAVVKGVLPQQSQTGWICGSYVLAGLIGAWIAGRNGKATLLRGLILGVLMVVIAWGISLLFSNGLDLAHGGWKLALAALAGCMAAGILRAGGGKGKRRRRRQGPGGGRRRSTR